MSSGKALSPNIAIDIPKSPYGFSFPDKGLQPCSLNGLQRSLRDASLNLKTHSKILQIFKIHESKNTNPKDIYE